MIFIFLISCKTIFGQNLIGILKNADSKQPIEFANIGIIGKNMGTVTDLNGCSGTATAVVQVKILKLDLKRTYWDLNTVY